MATKTRKTPTTRGKRSGPGTKARGQGRKTNMIGRGHLAGSKTITPTMVKNKQDALRFLQANDLFGDFCASTAVQNELQRNGWTQQNQQQNQPAKLTAGGRRTAQDRQAANA